MKQRSYNQEMFKAHFMDSVKKEREKLERFKNSEAYRKGFSQASRDGFYTSSKWRKLRARHLDENPLCVYCENETGRLVAANVVDHIISIYDDPDLALNADNLQSLCYACHRKKTKEDSYQRKLRKQKQRAERILDELERF